MLTTSILMTIFAALLVCVTVLYWRETTKLWKMARDGLIVDTFMRMMTYKFPSGEKDPEAWKDWAVSFNVATGLCISKELGDKMAEMIATMGAMRLGTMDEEIKAYRDHILTIISKKTGLPKEKRSEE